MRIRGWPLVTALTLLLNAAPPAKESPSTGGADPVRGDPTVARVALIDTLLAQHQYDSIQTIVSEMLPSAIATHDSALARGLVLARGRAQMFGGNLRGALESYGTVVDWSQAARDTARWMDGLRGHAYSSAGMGLRPQAVESYRQMLELARLQRDSIREAQALTGVAYLAMLGGDSNTARADYLQAIRIFRSKGDRAGELMPLVGLGRGYSSTGQIDSARACFQRVWVVATETHQNIEAAHALNNLGTLEHRYGALSLAMSYYQRAFDLHRANGEIAGAINAGSNLGLAQQHCGHYDAAAAIQEQLLAICNASGLRPQAASVMKNLGFANLSARRAHTARTNFRSALAMGDTLEKQVRIDAVFGLTDALAIDSLDVAISILQSEIARHAGADLTVDTVARVALARLLADRGDFEAARDEARRALLATEPLPPSSVRAMALLVASRCYREAGDADSAMTLFEQGVAALGTRSESDRTEKVTGDVVRGAQILLVHPPDRPVRERQAAFFDVVEEFRVRTWRSSIRDPRREDEHASRAVTLRELQSDILNPGDLVVQYFLTYRDAYVFAVSRDTSIQVVLGAGRGTSIARQVEDYCGAAAERPGASALSEADMTESQLALGRTLLGPVADLVARADRVIFVPDGYLHAVPFGSIALPDAQGDAQALLERATVFVLPSVSALAGAGHQESNGESEEPFLVFAGGDASNRSLPGAWSEARSIEKRYAGTVDCRGPIASRDLCDRMEGSGIIHLAAHIDVNEQNPWYSGIQVGNVPVAETPSLVRSASAFAILSAADSLQVARSFAPDAYLRASEIAGLSLSARLAVLSGCESALGQFTVGGGVVGLSAAFMAAGVPTVVGSLWKIDDRTTADLMRAFYDRLADGMSIAAALRGAQLEMRSRPRTAHPFHWAGFVVVGDGRATVPVVRESSLVPATLLAGGLLLLTLAVWALARNARRKSLRPL